MVNVPWIWKNKITSIESEKHKNRKIRLTNWVWCLCCHLWVWKVYKVATVLSCCSLCESLSVILFTLQLPSCKFVLSLCSPTSQLSLMFLSCSSRSNGLLSLSSSLHSISWSYTSQSGSLCFITTVSSSSQSACLFALCLWRRRIRCCVLGGVTLGRRINVMFRSKHIVHHPVPLLGCGSSFSSLCCPSLWVGPLASKKK